MYIIFNLFSYLKQIKPDLFLQVQNISIVKMSHNYNIDSILQCLLCIKSVYLAWVTYSGNQYYFCFVTLPDLGYKPIFALAEGALCSI